MLAKPCASSCGLQDVLPFTFPRILSHHYLAWLRPELLHKALKGSAKLL